MMAKLRGCRGFDALGADRTTIELEDETFIDLLAIADLVTAKKTQREKDSPMIRRLVDAHYWEFSGCANEKQIDFWLLESRSPDVLVELSQSAPMICRRLSVTRPLLNFAQDNEYQRLHQELAIEKKTSMQADQAYWQLLIKELEILRPTEETAEPKHDHGITGVDHLQTNRPGRCQGRLICRRLVSRTSCRKLAISTTSPTKCTYGIFDFGAPLRFFSQNSSPGQTKYSIPVRFPFPPVYPERLSAF
jgi:hypothetical protein